MVRSAHTDELSLTPEPTVPSGIAAARCGGPAAVEGYQATYNNGHPNASFPSHQQRTNHVRSGGSMSREEPPARSPGGGILKSSSFGSPTSHHANGTTSSSNYNGGRSPNNSLECNFDVNPTQLYLSLQAKRWDVAADRAQTHLAECSTWISRYEKPSPDDDRSKLRWRLLPLHAAVIFRAPPYVLSALLCSYPLGAASPDDQGMLPLHLAFRNGSSPQTVKLLLVAFPNSVDVEDRKGRRPMVLAKASRSEHRNEFVELLQRGKEYYAVAGASWSAGVNTGNGAGATNSDVLARVRQEYEARIAHMEQTHQSHLSYLQSQSNAELRQARSFASQSNTDLGRRAQTLQDELEQKADDNAVLAEHVSTLEGQLKGKEERERILNEQVRALQVQVQELEAERSGKGSFLEQERDAALADNMQLKADCRELESELKTVKQNLLDQSVQHTKVLADHDAEREEMDAALLGMEEELVQARQDVAKMEEKMATHDVTEQSLVAQITDLTRQLGEIREANGKVEEVYQRQVAELEQTKSNLQVDVDRLAYRLSSIGRALDAMVAEQDRIVATATEHEASMLRGLDVQRQMVEDATSQTAKIEQARREREDIVKMLARHADDIEQNYEQRRTMMEAVRRQEEEMRAVTARREELLVSVRMQKESLRALKETELGGGTTMPFAGGEARANVDLDAYARAVSPVSVPVATAPALSTSTGTGEMNYKDALDKLRRERDAALSRSKVDIKTFDGTNTSTSSSTASRGTIIKEMPVLSSVACPLRPAHRSDADTTEVPLPMSPYLDHTPEQAHTTPDPPSSIAMTQAQTDALEWAERALAQASEASEPIPSTPEHTKEPVLAPETPKKIDATTEPLPANPSLRCISSDGGIKATFSKPPLPPLPAAPTGDDAPYTLEGSFSEDPYGVPVENLTTEELIEEGQTALRKMPSLAGRDSPNSSDDGSEESEDHSDLSRSGCLLKHATSLANDDDEEEEHIIDVEGEIDDESALEREARELEGQLAQIQSQGSTIYGVVSMDSNSILASQSYMSEMLK